MDHHNRRTGAVARPELDDVQIYPGDLDDRPCAGKVRCKTRTPACVISASNASAATTTINIICDVLKTSGTNELRFYDDCGSHAARRFSPSFGTRHTRLHTTVTGDFI